MSTRTPQLRIVIAGGGGDAREALVRSLAPARSAHAAAALPAELTLREAEVLVLIAQGYSNPEIAQALFLSPHTVKSHISHIFAKTASRDRAQAVLFAREHQLEARIRRPPGPPPL